MSAGSKKENTYKMTPGIFEVESILQRGRSGNQIFYLIKWKGYSEQEATWEPQSNLSGCREAILEFQKIIKQLEQQKSAPESPSVKGKKKARRDKERKFLTSQSKELSQEEVINSGHLKRTQVQKLIPGVSETNKYQNDELQKLETQQNKNKQIQDISSSSQNEILESTTANTVQSNNADKRLTLIDHLIEKRKSQESSKSQINDSDKNISQKTTQNQKNPVKSSHQKIPEKQKETQLKRQRDKSENSLKRNQKISKKIKKQTSTEDQIQINNQLITHVQQKKTQIHKINVKKTQPQVFNPRPNNEVISQPLKIINQTIGKVKCQDVTIKSLSHRQILCEQEYRQLTIQILGYLDSRLKLNLKLEQDQINMKGLNNLRQKFIDITNPTFCSMNQKINKILLSKEQVEKFDNEGDFLYCEIEALLKLNLLEKDEHHYKWVCVLKDHQRQVNKEIHNQYFVKVDDLKSETWRKKFRKFLIPKQ